MEALFKLQHVLDLFVLSLLESLSKKSLAGNTYIYFSTSSFMFDILMFFVFAQVAYLFLGIDNSSHNTRCCHGVLCRESPLAIQGLLLFVFYVLR